MARISLCCLSLTGDTVVTVWRNRVIVVSTLKVTLSFNTIVNCIHFSESICELVVILFWWQHANCISSSVTSVASLIIPLVIFYCNCMWLHCVSYLNSSHINSFIFTLQCFSPWTDTPKTAPLHSFEAVNLIYGVLSLLICTTLVSFFKQQKLVNEN